MVVAATSFASSDARASTDAPRSYDGTRAADWAAPEPGPSDDEPEVVTPESPAQPSTDEPSEAAASASSDPKKPATHKRRRSRVFAKTPRILMPLTLRGESLRLGGYLQPGFVHYNNTDFYDDDQDGFDFANARITGHGEHTIKGQVAISFDFNFDVNAGNFSVRDAFGSVNWRKGLLRFDIGQLKQPSALSLLQYQWGLQFPFSPETRRLAFGRDQGVRISSGSRIKDKAWLSGAFMVANGEGGFRQRRNLDEKFQYTGRVEVGGLAPVDLDDPDLGDSKLGFVFGGYAGYTPSLGNGLGIDDVGASETRVGADVRLKYRGLSFRAEYLHGFRGANGEESPELERYATSIQAGYVIPFNLALPRFEVVFRFQQFDVNTRLTGDEGEEYVFDNTARRIYEPGINMYLYGHHAKLMLAYQLT
ncbi:MAG: hypothetical protein IAG13_30870, partial [Deltaproteobacteria bacterium]|nr:hypothetical protein [Nannocystaceae bacterium]